MHFFFKDHKKVGFGCVVRDSSGTLVMACSLPPMGLLMSIFYTHFVKPG